MKPVKSNEHKCIIAPRNYRRIVSCRCDAVKVADSFDMKQAISYHIPKMEFRDEGTKIIGRSTTVFLGERRGDQIRGGNIGRYDGRINRDQIHRDPLSMRQAIFFPTKSACIGKSIDQ